MRGDRLLFGFTFMVWKYLHQAVIASGVAVDLSAGALIHSGGWKKVADESVGNAEFKAALRDSTGLQRVHNFYGMVEQTGSRVPRGGRRLPLSIQLRRRHHPEPGDLAAGRDGQLGVVEVLSALPQSYPGHVLLTEDLGVVHGVGDPSSGWSGKRLEIIGRVPRPELRGCSDTHAFSLSVA